MRSFTTVSIAVAAIAATGLAACGSDDDDATPATPKVAAAPTVLSITTSDAAGKRFVMDAPPSIKGGLVRMVFTNDSKVPHEAQLIRVDGEHTIEEILKIVDTEDSVKIPEWLHAEGGVAAIPGGRSNTTTSNLPAGRYMVIDTETGGDDDAPSPATRGALAEFTVTAGTVGELPATPSVITISDDGTTSEDKYSFKTSGLRAGTSQVLFENASEGDESLHHVIAFPIAKGKTIADVRKAFASQNPTGPPPLDFANGTGALVLDAKRELVTTMTFKKGSYALLCFINDRDDTKPHIVQGLLSQVDVQ